MKTTVDRFGRVAVPKSMRTRLGLRAGSQVVIEEEGDRIVLRPADNEPALTLKDGILVFTGTADGDLGAAVTAVRERPRHERAFDRLRRAWPEVGARVEEP